MIEIPARLAPHATDEALRPEPLYSMSYERREAGTQQSCWQVHACMLSGACHVSSVTGLGPGLGTTALYFLLVF